MSRVQQTEAFKSAAGLNNKQAPQTLPAMHPCGQRTHTACREQLLSGSISLAPVWLAFMSLCGSTNENSIKTLHLKDSRHPVSLAWTYLEILSMLAICFWLRMTSMAAHTHWTTLGSACLFFTTRDMISLFISVAGAAGRKEISRFSLALPPTKVG